MLIATYYVLMMIRMNLTYNCHLLRPYPVYIKHFIILQVGENEYGLSKDADVSFWLDKRHFDGLLDLQEVGGGSFVLVTSLLHMH